MCAAEPTPYEALGTHQHATDALFKQLFRKMSLRNHPDKGGDKVPSPYIRIRIRKERIETHDLYL